MCKTDKIKILIKDVVKFEDKVKILIDNGLAISKGEARRLIFQVGENNL